MERTFISNTVDSKRSVEVTHEDCLQQTFSTDVGMALQFPQTHQGVLPAGCWGISSGGSLCRAVRTNSRPPRTLKVLKIIVRHSSKSNVDRYSYRIPIHHIKVASGQVTSNRWALDNLWLGITGFSSRVTCVTKVEIISFIENASDLILAGIPSCSTPAVAATMHPAPLHGQFFFLWQVFLQVQWSDSTS